METPTMCDCWGELGDQWLPDCPKCAGAGHPRLKLAVAELRESAAWADSLADEADAAIKRVSGTGSSAVKARATLSRLSAKLRGRAQLLRFASVDVAGRG